MITTSLHRIRLANRADRKGILDFIRDYWNPDHIYLKSESLFDFDLVHGDKINFLLAFDQRDNIDGILGFIPYTAEYEESDVFSVLWMVKPRNGDPTLGISLLRALIEDMGFRSVSTVGANPKTLPIYEFLGYSTGQLRHHFILNDQLSSFSLIQPADNLPRAGSASKTGSALKEYSTYGELAHHFDPTSYRDRPPYKSPWYLERRYFRHPVYKYMVFHITRNGTDTNSIIVTRLVRKDNAAVLRMVDFIGEPADLEGIALPIRDLLRRNACEYLDFYQHGIANEILQKAGFLSKDDYPGLVIPNHFEPFDAKNIAIHFFTARQGDICLFKADGDQDRPNRSTW